MKDFVDKVSLYFKDNKQSIGEIAVDAVIKESHSLSANITEHPTESGNSFCDHVQNLPVTIQMEGIISNTPMTFLGLTVIKSIKNYASNTSNNLSEVAFKKFEEIFEKREPITIATTLKVYDNMVLESLSVERAASTLHSLHFSASAKQITVVQQKLINMPKVKQSMGKQETKKISPKLKKEIEEITTKNMFQNFTSFSQYMR